MKKIISLLAVAILAFTITFAQTKKDSTSSKSKAVKRKPAATTNGGKPDMRYKMNKKP